MVAHGIGGIVDTEFGVIFERSFDLRGCEGGREDCQQGHHIRLLECFGTVALLLGHIGSKQPVWILPDPGNIQLSESSIKIITLPNDLASLVFWYGNSGRDRAKLIQFAFLQSDLLNQSIIFIRRFFFNDDC